MTLKILPKKNPQFEIILFVIFKTILIDYNLNGMYNFVISLSMKLLLYVSLFLILEVFE